MASSRRRVALLAGGAFALLVWAPAAAGIPDSWPRFHEAGEGHVEPVDGVVTVCEWWMEFQPVAGGEIGSWELWQGGTKIDGDPYEVGEPGSTPDREPTFTNFTLPEGEYVLVWDDESPVDSSRHAYTVAVSCPDQSTPTPSPFDSPTPAPTGSADPTASAGPTHGVEPTDTPEPAATASSTGSALPTEGTPTPTSTPTGTVAAETGTPRLTLPPTDGMDGPRLNAARGLPLMLLVLGLAAVGVSLSTRLPHARLARRNRRRSR